MRARFASCAAAAMVSWASTVGASTEVILVLDNSCSMIAGATFGETGRAVPAADPDRLSVLATLILAAVMDEDDQLTILTFQSAPPHFRTIPATPDSIRALAYDGPTLFSGAFDEARRILTASTRPRKLLLMLTDGMPNDIASAEEARTTLGIAATAPFSIVAVGLSADPDVTEQQRLFLGPLTDGVGRYEAVSDPRQLIERFTEAYAETLGSKPLTGAIDPGSVFEFGAPKYVSNVLVMTASVERRVPATVTLSHAGQVVPSKVSGDNGCSTLVRYRENPSYCVAPFNTYKVWSAKKDPERSSRWALSLGGEAASAIAYGIILRYDLAAEIQSISSGLKAGQALSLTGRVRWRDETFDDEAFFTSDGFEAYALVRGEKVPVSQKDGGQFELTHPVKEPGPLTVTLVFENRWMKLASPPRTVMVEGWLPLSLVAAPLDFGAWRGDWQPTRSCRTLDLSGSSNADKVPLELVVDRLPSGVEVAIAGETARPGGAVPLPEGGLKHELCVIAARCCQAADGAAAAMTIRGRDPHYHPSALTLTPAFSVREAGFLRCWWPVIAGAAGVVAFLLLVYGFVSPHSFEEGVSIRFGKKPTAVAKARRVLLAEQPGGRRGFYRHATAGFDAGGEGLAPRKKALLRLIAAPAGDVSAVADGNLEIQNRRTRKWETVASEEATRGIQKRALHRVGDFHFKLE